MKGLRDTYAESTFGFTQLSRSLLLLINKLYSIYQGLFYFVSVKVKFYFKMDHRHSEIKHHAHIQNSVGVSVAQSDGEEGVMNTGYYTLPACRFTILVQVLLFTDLVSSVALWLCGGDNEYLEDNVMQFKIKDSVFDLAAIAFVKCSILFFSYHWLEKLSMKQIDYPYDRKLASRKCWCHFLAIFLSLGSLAYSITKGVLIYKVRSQKEHKLHPTYFALVISAVAFSFLETVFALSSFVAMRRLKLLRILHTPNDTEAKRKPQVNLGRLMTLAKPVSVLVDFVNILLAGLLRTFRLCVTSLC